MFVLPLVGWGMLSAARYPIVLFGSLHLPFILPHDAMLYAVLRKAHTILAYLFFLTFLAHFGAILFHTLIVRDGILKRMVPWNVRTGRGRAGSSNLKFRQTTPLLTQPGRVGKSSLSKFSHLAVILISMAHRQPKISNRYSRSSRPATRPMKSRQH